MHAGLFIYPGFEFRCVNAILTNFHLPDSTLILLVAAYRQAIEQEYRFYYYGDCMLIA